MHDQGAEPRPARASPEFYVPEFALGLKESSTLTSFFTYLHLGIGSFDSKLALPPSKGSYNARIRSGSFRQLAVAGSGPRPNRVHRSGFTSSPLSSHVFLHPSFVSSVSFDDEPTASGMPRLAPVRLTVAALATPPPHRHRARAGPSVL